jgi:hypothetical protein
MSYVIFGINVVHLIFTMVKTLPNLITLEVLNQTSLDGSVGLGLYASFV